MEATTCPSALLDRDGGDDALDVVSWWLGSSPMGAFGGPSGPPEWPLPGGFLMQPALLVEAVEVLRNEWPYLRPAKAPAPGRATRTRRRR